MLVATIAMLAASPTPSRWNQRVLDTELSMFIHFSMCTFTNCEHNTAACRRASHAATEFRPTALDADQWVRTAKDLGAKQACLTAHHDGGFANWPTNLTDYGVRQATGWRGGNGDVLRVFSDACRRHNVSMCFYVSELLDCWESGDTVEAYLARLRGMLRELLTGYGAVSRIYYDFFGFGNAGRPSWSPAGAFPAGWASFVSLVREVSPETVMLPGPDGCENPLEAGQGVYPVWTSEADSLRRGEMSGEFCGNCSNDHEGCSGSGSPNGTLFAPHESTLSIQNSGDYWFHHDGAPYLNAALLWWHYLRIVGRGSSWILNIPPNASGVVPEEYRREARLLGTAVRETFGTAVAEHAAVSAACADLSLVLEVPSGAAFDAVVLQEDLSAGQQIRRYAVDVDVGGEWRVVPGVHGLSVGRKVIDLIPPPHNQTASVRVRCVSAAGGARGVVSLARVALHLLRPPPPTAARAQVRSYWSPSTNDTAPCALRSGGTCDFYPRTTYGSAAAECIAWYGATARPIEPTPSALLSRALRSGAGFRRDDARLPRVPPRPGRLCVLGRRRTCWAGGRVRAAARHG